MRFAAVEGGGTKWLAAITDANDPSIIHEKCEFETTVSPEETLTKVKIWLKERSGTFEAIGIASFGPVDLNKSSSTYGFITSTPKPGWQNTNVLGLLGIYDEFSSVPFLFDTDVNAPAMAEFTYYNKNTDNSTISSTAYITIGILLLSHCDSFFIPFVDLFPLGTGVGVGLIVNGSSVKGLLHPEGGHISVRPCHQDLASSFTGSCPFHGGCIEGMCSIGSLSKRLNCSKHDLPSFPDSHQIWEIAAYYIAELCVTLILLASPERISIGGGVLKRTLLYSKIREQFLKSLNRYIQHPLLTEENIDRFIVEPLWKDEAGLVGAAYLAYVAYHDHQNAIAK
jgi:fructokinase